MTRIRLLRMALLSAVLLFAVACGNDTDDSSSSAGPEQGEVEDADTGEHEDTVEAEELGDVPTDLNIALILEFTTEDTWSSSMTAALDRLVENPPHDLDVSYEILENIAYADGELVLRQTAETGDFDIIIAHSAYSDGVLAVQDEFPDIPFVFTGAGNEGSNGNAYHLDMLAHEPAYIAGVAAGMLNETGVIGSVAAFPFPNVNGGVNAFFDGARSVNPDIETRVTYIESWFDPPTAQAAGAALIEEGADTLYAASTFGTFNAALEAERVFAVGDLDDQEALAPEVVYTSVLVLWDPGLRVLVDAWYDHATNGTPYDAPDSEIKFGMSDGGADVAPFNEAILPPEVVTAMNEVRDQILSGELVLEFNPEPAG